MRPFLFVCAVLLVPAVTRADVIGVYTDLGGGCLLRDRPLSATLYVVHRLNPGATASRFRIELSEGMTGTMVSFDSPFTTSGEPLAGIHVEYPPCIVGDHVVLELDMVFFGTSARCSWIRAGAHPSSGDGMLDVYDCALNREPASWEGTHVDPVDGTKCPSDGCGCHGGCCCRPYSLPVLTELETWGGIKALYR